MDTVASSIGFLGYGNMARAIALGLRSIPEWETAVVCAFDPDPAAAERTAGDGVVMLDTASALVGRCDSIVLAVKPQVLQDAVAPLVAAPTKSYLALSIAAGIPATTLHQWLGTHARIVRIMPNTPALVGAGLSALASGPGATPEDMLLATRIFAGLGVAVTIDESQMDAVTALSGSGPAYFFRLAECLAEAGIAHGLDPALAGQLAAYTLFGAGKLLVESGDPPAVLRERVTSKGGVTAAALAAFEDAGLGAIVLAAYEAAVARSRELGTALRGS